MKRFSTDSKRIYSIKEKNALKNIKSAIRSKILDKRNSLSIKEKRNASRNAISIFMGNVPIEKKDIIASFVSIAGEIDITFLTEILYENGNKIALPVVTKKHTPLSFRTFDPKDSMIFNEKYNIYEPLASQKELIPTVIIVPLIACDKEGNRIGFGGGFYDRTIELLEKRREIFKVGIAYDFQVLNEIPISEHDQQLDCIITDKEVIICHDNRRIKDS